MARGRAHGGKAYMVSAGAGRVFPPVAEAFSSSTPALLPASACSAWSAAPA